MSAYMLMIVLLLSSPAGGPEESLDAQLDTARQRYDVRGAEEILAKLQEEQRGSGTPSAALLTRACLLVAELYRIDYEDTPESERTERRALGAKIDSAAREGLRCVEMLPESSLVSNGFAISDPARSKILIFIMGVNDKFDSGNGGAVNINLSASNGQGYAPIQAISPRAFGAGEMSGNGISEL